MKRGALLGLGTGIALVAAIWGYAEFAWADYQGYSFDLIGQLLAVAGLPTIVGLAELASVWSAAGSLGAGVVAVLANWTIIGLGLGGLISWVRN